MMNTTVRMSKETVKKLKQLSKVRERKESIEQVVIEIYEFYMDSKHGR